MESLDVSHVGVGLSLDSRSPSLGNLKRADIFISDLASSDNLLLEDLDSYLEDIDGRLRVSRMVSDSVIKGMVNAVSEEAAEKIASKEAETTLLKKRLQLHKSYLDKQFFRPAVFESERVKFKERPSFLDLGVKNNFIEDDFSNLKIAAEEQLQRFKKEVKEVKDWSSFCRSDQEKVLERLADVEKGLVDLDNVLEKVFRSKAQVCEWQWEREFQEEVNGIVFQSLFRTLRGDFEDMHREQSCCLFGSHNKNMPLEVNELSNLRQDLNAICRSLFSPESGKLLSHGSFESVEEWTNERKDCIHRKLLGSHPCQAHSLIEKSDTTLLENTEESKSTTSEVTESAQLKHMTKEELINYFKTEMTKMKRNHESSVQKITESYFSLKREFLKEKGSSHGRKDKDFDALREKILKIILKLDDILVGKEKFQMACNDYDNICNLQDKAHNLLMENQLLRDELADKIEEIKSLSSQVANATNKMSNHSMVKANFLKQTEKLSCDIEDAEIENFIREETCKCFLKDLISKMKCDVEDSDIQDIFVLEICGIIFREAFRDVEASTDQLMTECNKEKERRICLEGAQAEHEKILCLAIEQKDKLKDEILLLVGLMEEKERSASEVRSTLAEQRQHSDVLCQELNMLRDQIKQQEKLLVVNQSELDSTKCALEEALEQISMNKLEMNKLNEKFEATMNDLRDAEAEICELHGNIQEKEIRISSAIANEKEHRKQVQSIFVSVQVLSDALANFECKVVENIIRNNSRIIMLNKQCIPLIQQANLLISKVLVHKQRLERRCADLQMAEAEVDLLGDEVDALVNLLSRIYVALEHYSTILQHYPGIMEVLKLIRKELKGESAKPIDQLLFKHHGETSITKSIYSAEPRKRTIISRNLFPGSLTALRQ